MHHMYNLSVLLAGVHNKEMLILYNEIGNLYVSFAPLFIKREHSETA